MSIIPIKLQIGLKIVLFFKWDNFNGTAQIKTTTMCYICCVTANIHRKSYYHNIHNIIICSNGKYKIIIIIIFIDINAIISRNNIVNLK